MSKIAIDENLVKDTKISNKLIQVMTLLSLIIILKLYLDSY